MSPFIERHSVLLDAAMMAAERRGYWSAFPETPSGKIYGETAKADGEAAFKALLGKPFEITPSGAGLLGRESSPWGVALDIGYPRLTVDQAVGLAKKAGRSWSSTTGEERVGVCLEIIHRLNRSSFLIANAVMHTTGQSFVMAFQAGGPHAQDRGLEAVAYAYAEMRKVPARARWEKAQGGSQEALKMEKTYHIRPRGVAAMIGCATFPTWNGYPGLFASLATGNTVVVKPHPMAILPLAISVRIAREVLSEAGHDPDTVVLLADEPDAPVTKDLVDHPDVMIVDFTGSSAFGRWIREHAASRKQVFTEEAGVNSIVIDSTTSFKGMTNNIAFSLALYSGQMCTAPQAIFVPAGGIETDEGRKSFGDVAAGICKAIERLVSSPDRAAGILGTIQNPATLERLNDVAGRGEVLLASRRYDPPEFPGSRTATPLVLAASAENEGLYGEERFGPISFIVRVADTAEGLRIASTLARQRGAITASIYSKEDSVLDAAAEAFADAGVSLSCNLTGGVFVNQSAAFSDYHVSGANPAGNACLTDAAFVANRFHVVGVRRPAA